METVFQVNFNHLSRKETIRTEAILREYLLRVSDQVCMARIGSSSFSLFSFIPHGFEFKKFISMLHDEDIASKDKRSWMFNLTDNVKNLFNQATLLFTGSGRFFSGFADPKFFKNGHEMASFVSNEKLLTLYIPDTDKALLATQGVSLDEPEM
jgi:hypothetical protein